MKKQLVKRLMKIRGGDADLILVDKAEITGGTVYYCGIDLNKRSGNELIHIPNVIQYLLIKECKKYFRIEHFNTEQDINKQWKRMLPEECSNTTQGEPK